jgi:hypothetical protein
MSIINNSVTTINAGQIGPVHKIEDNVFTANAVAPTGEPIYLAMEPMGDGKKWESYRTSAQFLTNGGDFFASIGKLAELGSLINDGVELNKFFERCTIPEFWTYDKARFEELITKLKERKITLESAKAKELNTIPHASNGMNVREQTHVVYVSKVPVTGIANFDRSSSDNQFDFGRYVTKYDSLVMSVGVKIEDIVENRGIFRNPWSIIQGGYGGISMMVHSFTCMVIQEHWPSVKLFEVRPLKNMGEIFMNSVPKEQFTINGIQADQYHGGFETEQNILVPIEVLADLHRAK